MMNKPAAWIAASLTTMAMDLLWLGVVAKDFYRKHLGHLMAGKVGWPAALAFYVLYGGGVLYFCAGPALREGSPKTALINGALFGLVMYGTYDLTNMAILRDWGGLISAADIAWGVVITSAASAAAFTVGRR